MHSSIVNLRSVTILTVALMVTGCQQKSPIEQMEWERAKYEASLNAFVAKPVDVAPEPTDSDADAAGEEEVGEIDGELAAALAAEAVTGPVESNILLDFVLRTDSDDRLPGITLDVTMGNAAGEKERWTVWVDTSELGRGTGTQMIHELKGVMYEEGDGFHVEVRHPIPEEERTTYREYADAT